MQDTIARALGANANARIDSIETGNPPYINETNKHWMVWNPDTNQYEDSEIVAEGKDGTSMQVTTMPAASASYVDQVLQYIGETTSDYTQGLFYICELQGSTYAWNHLPVDDGLRNIATGAYSLTVAGSNSPTNSSTNVGVNSAAYGWGASAYGCDAKVGTNEARVPGAIQIGRGQNTEAGTMYVGLSTNGSTWNNYKLLGSDGKVPLGMVTTVNNVTTTDSTDPLAAGQGKLLNDRINNLENIGRFLAIWNCSTGLPLTNPTSLPYEYKTGDYYRVGAIAGSYTHTLSMAGSTTSLGIYEGTYTLGFNLSTSSATQLTTVAMVIAAMDDSTRYSATGTLTTSDTTYTITSALKWTQDGADYIAICDSSEQKLALISASTTHTDTVTGGTTNYKPNGDTYTGTASVTVETERVAVGDLYYYDGTTWVMQAASAGGTVQDVQINGTSIVASDTGIANIPYASTSAGGVIKASNTNGFDVTTGTGYAKCLTKTVEAYNSSDGNLFVGKGTLENVAAARGWIQNIKTTLDSTLVVNTEYYLGEQSSLTLTLPSTASAGQIITVDFASGSTATTLSISGNVVGDTTYTPSANTLDEINFKYDGTYWKMLVSSVDTPSN